MLSAFPRRAQQRVGARVARANGPGEENLHLPRQGFGAAPDERRQAGLSLGPDFDQSTSLLFEDDVERFAEQLQLTGAASQSTC